VSFYCAIKENKEENGNQIMEGYGCYFFAWKKMDMSIANREEW
jgi:hypothetical protein